MHSFQLGKKPNVDPFTGKKDEEHSLYSFASHVNVNNWTFFSRWSPSHTQFNALWDNGLFNYSFHGQYLDENRNGFEMEGGITKADMCVQFKYQFPMIGVSYTQPIWAGHSVGVEYLYGLLNGVTRLKCIGKRENKEAGSTTLASVSTALSGASQYSMSYIKSVSKNMDIVTGIDLSYSEPKWSSLFKVGYNYKGEMGNVRAMWDSSFKVMCMVEEQMPDFPFAAQFCCKIDYAQNLYEVGIGWMQQC